MNVTWTGARFPTIDVEEIKRGCVEKKRLQWGHNAKFRYPKYGGNAAQWHRVAELLPQERLHPNHKVVKISPKDKLVHFENGTSTSYDKIVSTMPLPHLLDIIDVEDPVL
jgi:UDP-galactopyranose mutase